MNAFFMTHWMELTASLTGLMNLCLLIRAHQANWFFGMITVSLYFVIFMKARLYGNMCLQMVFLSLQAYGYCQWRKAGRTRHGTLAVRTLTGSGRIRYLLLTLGLYGLIGLALQTFTHSTLVWLDSLLTAMSLVAQWLMARRTIEHWVFWMGVDLISVDLYWQKSLYFSCGLYLVYLGFCIQGFLAWHRFLEHRKHCET